MRAVRPSIALVLLAVVTGLGVIVVAATTDGDDVAPPSASRPAPTAAAPTPPASPPVPAPTPASPSALAPSPLPPPPPGRAELEQRLDEVVSSPGLRRQTARVGVVVRDAHGRTLLDVAGDLPLLPASTQKLVTAAAAMEIFGPDHRFATTAAATTTSRSGTVVGTLVLIGSGDPVLATEEYQEHVYPARPRTPLEVLADGIAEAGVEWITGGIVGDASVLGGENRALGWPPHYLRDFDGRHIRGLTVDAGLDVIVEGSAGTPELELHQAPDPAQHAVATLARLLRERGVTVSGELRTVSSTAPHAPHPVATVRSPPMHELLRHMVQRSDNHLADTLFRLVGAAGGGDGSWASGARAARSVLMDLDVDVGGVFLADGSGLSRHNRLTARLLADLDAEMTTGDHGAVWRGLMAVAGREGTLRHRLRGTVADGSFLGKTGTLDDVTAVAGTIAGPGGDYHLAVIGNDAEDERGTIRTLADELVLTLAEDQRGCQRRPAQDPTPSPTALPTPPYVEPHRLVCPQPVPEPTSRGHPAPS